MNKICATCKFCSVGNTCHRFPPPFPAVQERDWCGEWKHDGKSEMNPVTGKCEKPAPPEPRKP